MAAEHTRWFMNSFTWDSHTCLPEDILVFFTTAWLAAHAGSAACLRPQDPVSTVGNKLDVNVVVPG